MNEERSYDLGFGVRVRLGNKEEKKGLGARQALGDLDKDEWREHRKTNKRGLFEMAEDLTVRPSSHADKRIENFRELDVDGLGKKKTGLFSLKDFRKK